MRSIVSPVPTMLLLLAATFLPAQAGAEAQSAEQEGLAAESRPPDPEPPGMVWHQGGAIRFKVPAGWRLVSSAEDDCGGFFGSATYEKAEVGRVDVWCRYTDAGELVFKDLEVRANEIAPMGQDVKLPELQTEGVNPSLWVYRGEQVKKGAWQPVTLIYGYKRVALKDIVSGCDYKLFAEASSTQNSAELEQTVAAIAATLTPLTGKEKSAREKRCKEIDRQNLAKVKDYLASPEHRKMRENFDAQLSASAKKFSTGEWKREKLKQGYQDYETMKVQSFPEEVLAWRTEGTLRPFGLSGNPIAVSQITAVPGGRLLVFYDDDIGTVPPVGKRSPAAPALIETASGKLLWSYGGFPERDSDGFWLYDSLSIVAPFQDLLILRGDGSVGSKVEAVDSMGGTRWTLVWAHQGQLELLPYVGDGVLVAILSDNKRVDLHGYSLATGKELWARGCEAAAGSEAAIDFPSAKAGFWAWCGGLEFNDPRTGQARWRREDLLPGSSSPTPKSDGQALYLVDSKNSLQVLQADSGRSDVVVPLRSAIRCTSIEPLGARIYVRGLEEAQGRAPRHVLVAVRKEDGKILWEYGNPEPGVTNLIEKENALYFATNTTLMALERETAVILFTAPAADTGGKFPATLHEYGDRIVYVGELVVAAFDAKTGQEIYRHGFDPLSQEQHLDAIDAYIAKLAKVLRKYGSIGKGALEKEDGGVSGPMYQFMGSLIEAMDPVAGFERAQTLQKQASAHQQSSSEYYSKYMASTNDTDRTSNYYQSEGHRLSAKMDRAFARNERLQASVEGLVQALHKAISDITAVDRRKARWLYAQRRLLRSVYALSDEGGDYVWRPTLEPSGSLEKVGIEIVHLPTGKSVRAPLTSRPAVDVSLGLHALVDPERGWVYFQGLRLAPDEDQSEALKAKNKANYGVYLIAKPLPLPR